MISSLLLAGLLIGQTDFDRDEELVFYPTYACRGDDGAWRADVRGWVYEIDKAPVIVEKLCERFEVALAEVTGDAKALLIKRASPFLFDNERNQRIAIRIGERVIVSEPSEPNGHFAIPVRLPEREVAALRQSAAIANGWLNYAAVMRPGDGRSVRGELEFVETRGLSVISDIDDTIKISEVRNKKALMANTFLKPFRAVPGMAEVYQGWARRQGTAFFYVSGNPWQLYGPVREFIDAEKYPAGTYFLKSFRAKDKSLIEFLGAQDDYKLRTIQPIMADFPFRSFVMVGDSGEQDPEIYGELARRNPMQVVKIFIRNVTGEGPSAPRYAEAFRGVPAGMWMIFDDPAAIRDAIPEAVASRDK